MPPRTASATRRPSRLTRLLERVVLGVLMAVAARLVERRLRRVLGRMGHDGGAGRGAP